MNDNKAFDKNLDEVVYSRAIKKALDENKPVEFNQTFKRNHVEFDQIHRHLYSMMSDAIKMSGEYVDSLGFFEEQLTPAEYFTLEAFYKWIEAGEKECPECGGKGWRYVDYHTSKRGNEEQDCQNCTKGKIGERDFGSGNYQERYDEWLATLRYELRARQIVTVYEDAQTEKVVEGQAELLIKESTGDDGLQLWSVRFVGKTAVEYRKVKP